MLYQTLFLFLSFAFGSLPFGYLIIKMLKHDDIRKYGSGSIGATNVARVANFKWAILTFLLDGLKGVFAVILAKYVFNNAEQFYYYLIAFFAILGHIFTPILNFKGGKGVATFILSLLSLNYNLVIVMVIAWIICFFKTKISSLSALTGALITSIWSLFLIDYKSALVVFMISSLIFWAHRENIKRLLNRQENSFKKN